MADSELDPAVQAQNTFQQPAQTMGTPVELGGTETGEGPVTPPGYESEEFQSSPLQIQQAEEGAGETNGPVYNPVTNFEAPNAQTPVQEANETEVLPPAVTNPLEEVPYFMAATANPQIGQGQVISALVGTAFGGGNTYPALNPALIAGQEKESLVSQGYSFQTPFGNVDLVAGSLPAQALGLAGGQVAQGATGPSTILGPIPNPLNLAEGVISPGAQQQAENSIVNGKSTIGTDVEIGATIYLLYPAATSAVALLGAGGTAALAGATGGLGPAAIAPYAAGASALAQSALEVGVPAYIGYTGIEGYQEAQREGLVGNEAVLAGVGSAGATGLEFGAADVGAGAKLYPSLQFSGYDIPTVSTNEGLVFSNDEDLGIARLDVINPSESSATPFYSLNVEGSPQNPLLVTSETGQSAFLGGGVNLAASAPSLAAFAPPLQGLGLGDEGPQLNPGFQADQPLSALAYGNPSVVGNLGNLGIDSVSFAPQGYPTGLSTELAGNLVSSGQAALQGRVPSPVLSDLPARIDAAGPATQALYGYVASPESQALSNLGLEKAFGSSEANTLLDPANQFLTKDLDVVYGSANLPIVSEALTGVESQGALQALQSAPSTEVTSEGSASYSFSKPGGEDYNLVSTKTLFPAGGGEPVVSSEVVFNPHPATGTDVGISGVAPATLFGESLNQPTVTLNEGIQGASLGENVGRNVASLGQIYYNPYTNQPEFSPTLGEQPFPGEEASTGRAKDVGSASAYFGQAASNTEGAVSNSFSQTEQSIQDYFGNRGFATTRDVVPAPYGDVESPLMSSLSEIDSSLAGSAAFSGPGFTIPSSRSAASSLPSPSVSLPAGTSFISPSYYSPASESGSNLPSPSSPSPSPSASPSPSPPSPSPSPSPSPPSPSPSPSPSPPSPSPSSYISGGVPLGLISGGLPSGGGGGTGFELPVPKFTRKSKYEPSLTAEIFGIHGKISRIGIESGIAIRPLPVNFHKIHFREPKQPKGVKLR